MTNPLSDRLLAQHRDNPAPFLILEDERDISFARFAGLAAQMAHVLADHGVAPGARVLVQAPKSAETLALYAGALMAGAVFLPLNTAYTVAELAYFIEDAAPRLIVCESARAADLAPLAEAAGAALLTLDADGTGSLSAAMTEHTGRFAPRPRAGDDLVALLYTSGTTGRSKGAMLSQDNLLSNAEVLVKHWEITDRDVLLHALPIFHTHGLFVAINTALMAGTRVHLMARFDPDAILARMPEATLMMGVPTFYTRLLDDPRLNRETAARMRLFISGSAPLLAETHRAFTARTGHEILERYGMTETNMTTSNPYRGRRKPGTVGPPLPGVELRVCDDAGRPLPQGETGMIEVRGPNVFQGYRNMPEKTAEEMRDDGFFITGDLGHIDGDGYVSIVGRAKDLIITGGLNVYPKEVEDVLNAQPGVAESAVFGVPDPDFGEAVVAAVVADPGAQPDETALADAIAAQLARFKHPRRLVMLDALPRNAMGKVQKAALRADYGG